MDYPGRVIEASHADGAVIGAIQARLAERGYPLNTAGGVDPATAFMAAVSFFQSTHVDIGGRPLKVDGKVGPNTWGALFGAPALASGITAKALAVAQTQVGVREQPPGSNAGPEVTPYLASVGLNPGYAWCMAFIHWCFVRAANGGANPSPAVGGVLEVLRRVQQHSPPMFVAKADALADPTRVQPGSIFILDHGGGTGHTGFVKAVSGGGLRTIEGNSNDGGSREGVGVFELTRRSLTDHELVGFIDFGR